MSCLDFVLPQQSIGHTKKNPNKKSFLPPEPPGSAPQEGSVATGLLRAGAEKGSAMEEPENTRSQKNPVPLQLLQNTSCGKGWQVRSEFQVEIKGEKYIRLQL